MSESLKIYIDRLKGGHKESIHEMLSASFLDVNEESLEFIGPILLTGSAYLVEGELILHLSLELKCLIPCRVCNKKVEHAISIHNSYQNVPIKDIKSAVFDMSELLREMILLEVPAFLECRGSCPERKELNKFLSRKVEVKSSVNNPFSQLDIEELPKE
jgi:uncharacterized metal-binding protein YceD (DUF177 family)